MMSLKPPNPIPINPSSSSSPTNPKPNSLPFPAKSLSPLPKTPLSLSLSTPNPNSIQDPLFSSQDHTLLTLLRQRKTEEAWSLYSQCLHLPSATCLSRLVAQLSYQNTADSLKRAQSIISRLRRDRHLSRLDSNSLGLLAGAAARAGHVRYAASLVKSMLRSGHLPHLKSWSAVVSRLSNSPDDGPAEALRLFRTLCRRISSLSDRDLAGDSKPDAAAFNAALNAAANSGDGEAFRDLFEEMPKWGCEPDVLSFNVMIKLAARLGKVETLPMILEAILEKSDKGGSFFCVTTIHSLVAAYVGFGDLEMAERIVQGMREGRRDILEILRRNSRDGQNVYHEDDVFEKMLRNRRGEEKGDNLLPKSYPADSRMYTTLMKGYLRMGRVTDTVRMLEAMRCQGGEAGRPDEVSYTTVVTALANAGSMERARQVVAEMGRLGVPANRVTYNALLKGHCRRLEVQEAKDILREMGRTESNGGIGPEPDVVSYNIVMDGCVSVDDTAGAVAVFNDMRARGIAPSKVSYTTLMKAFSASGQPKLADKVFDEMLNDPRVKADIVAWNVLVQAYCRLGFVEEAKRVMERMKEGGVSPNVATYGSLANGIGIARKPGEALLLWSEVKERCSEKTLRPDEGLLDALADICVRAAFFKKALEIVACMEENGIAPNKTKYTRIYVEMHSRMFTSKHASQARQDRRKERKRAAEAFKFWLGLPNTYYGSEWRLEPGNDYSSQ